MRRSPTMRLMLVAALLGAATGIPIGSKRQQAEQRLKSLVSRMLQDEEPRSADLHEGRMPGAEEDDKDLGTGVCPSYVSINGNAGGRLQVNDEYCDKNCRMGFCPPDKCRCSTDRDTSTHGLIGTPDDACPKYVTLEEDGGKSKFNQVDDDWCDSNCRGNFLSCPKDKCRCFTDTQALKDYRDAKEKETAREAMVKEKVAAPMTATEEESLGGNCPKFVGLPGADDANPKFKRWASGANNDECECPPLETRATNPAHQLARQPAHRLTPRVACPAQSARRTAARASAPSKSAGASPTPSRSRRRRRSCPSRRSRPWCPCPWRLCRPRHPWCPCRSRPSRPSCRWRRRRRRPPL